MHARNRHRQGYDFAALIACSPDLGAFVSPAPHGGPSIDFADPAAVKALNRALLVTHYGIVAWDIPPRYLCPPIPGRADYLHHAADLLASENGGMIPRGPDVRVLDIGVGANCIYPIIGRAEYGWEFIGTDVDPVALRHAETIVRLNPRLDGRVQCRLQRSPTAIFRGVVRAAERFALAICNPPFHASPQAAASGTRRKLKNLHGAKGREPMLNFGGTPAELWCPGGERAFAQRMIAESAEFAAQCRWFTTLISKSTHLPAIERALRHVHAAEVRTIAMAQGQKKSRIVAWRF